jgi:outer membrane protein, heavy metal efflux system
MIARDCLACALNADGIEPMKFALSTARGLSSVLLTGLLALPLSGAALTLEEALQLAEDQAPALDAQRASLDAARSSAIPAGALPDPKLRLGLQNVPIEGDARWQLDEESMTMQMVGLSQDVPNRAKRRARVEGAQASIALAGAQQQLTRLQVRQQTAEAWITVLATERKLALFSELYRENELLSRAVNARLAGGRGMATDSILPRQEAALLADQEDALRRDQAISRAALRSWIGDAAEQPLSGSLPAWAGDFEHYLNNIVHHPALQTFDSLSRQREAEVAEAVAGRTPDWGWGLDYQRRGRGFGDMVSLSLSFDLPVFAGSRQNPRIAAEQARLSEVGFQREALLRQYQSALAEDFAEHLRLEHALARLEQTFLPLAEEKVRLAMADYRSGRGELGAVIAARAELIETRLRGIDLARDKALAKARLHFPFGDTP